MGGLVGALGSGGITNSYTAGLVSAPDGVSKGFFVGATKDDAVLTMNNNQYISMLNDASGMNPIGKDSASAADADLDSYRAFAPSTAGAFPYDSWLKTHYNVKYPFKTISLLGGSAIPSLPHLTQHYGDWPALETFVINTSNGTSNG